MSVSGANFSLVVNIIHSVELVRICELNLCTFVNRNISNSPGRTFEHRYWSLVVAFCPPKLTQDGLANTLSGYVYTLLTSEWEEVNRVTLPASSKIGDGEESMGSCYIQVHHPRPEVTIVDHFKMGYAYY
jgi:hypothetical protein